MMKNMVRYKTKRTWSTLLFIATGMFSVYLTKAETVDCGTLDCKNGATCYISEKGYKVCNCTEGFGGPICDQSSVIALRSDIRKATTLDAQRAEAYAAKAQEMLQGQMGQNYKDIEGSAIYVNSLAALLVEKTGLGATPGDDLTTLTQEIAGITSSVLTAASACASAQLPGCTMSPGRTKDIVDETEENLGNMLYLMLNVSVINEPLPINKGNISMTVFKSSGDSLLSSYNTNYGKLSLPYWETFQDSNKDKYVLLSLVSYKSNPYVHSSNKDEVSGSVLKINATTGNGEELKLEDPDDPAVLAVDMSSVFDDDSTWKEMEKFESVNGAFMIARNFNISLNAIIVEIKLKTVKTCTTYGKYSQDEPGEDDFDILIITKGKSRIEDSRPDELPVAFDNQILRITMINENITEPIHPIVITVLCEDYKLGSFGLPIHEYRIADVDLRFFDKKSGTWNQSNGLKAYAAKGKSIGFKSNFFGTFSANALFIPPQPINFDEIFLNFHERLKSTPHFLVVSCFIVLVSVILSIPMMKMDKHDRLLWSKLPLVDCLPDANYSYDIIVYTDVRSAKYFTSSVYIDLKGKQGRTGIRILKDGQRENFGRGTSSYFTMKTKEHLGKLLELRIWHDNKGTSAKWLLSRVIITDTQSKERYVFHCGKWLSVDQDDGRTWRKLRPVALDIIGGNDMFNELSKRNLFDDHLWLSMSMRPTYSCFTRVQRLWTLVALLFLSMITSAMWYDTPDQSNGNGIKIGPLKLNYKMVYVGFMSSVISIFPSLIIMQIFKNRRLKRSKSSERKEKNSHVIKRPRDARNFENIDDLAELESIFSEDPDEVSGGKNKCVAEYKCTQIGYDVSDGNQGHIPNIGFTGDSFYAKILNSTQGTICPVTTNETMDYKQDNKTANFQNSPGSKSLKEALNYQKSPFRKPDQYQNDNKNIRNKPYFETFSEEDSEANNLFSKTKFENREKYEGNDCDMPQSRYRFDKHEDEENVKIITHKEVWMDDKDSHKQKCCAKRECLLPWWFIFFAYLLVVACIGSSSFFTFMYTLEWGSEKTGEWMMAFFFGTLENILFIEPIKVVIFALLVSCLFKSVALKYFGDSNNTSDESNSSENSSNNNRSNGGQFDSIAINITAPLMEYPGNKEDDKEMRELKKRLLLDRRLNEKIKSWIYQFLYILVLGIICSHNIITASYYQNTELAQTLTPTTKLIERSDIWKWLEGQLLNATFPKWYYNNMVRPAYVQRFAKNTYNLKLGPVRIRQVRSKGSCVVNSIISDVVSICPQTYSFETEETNNFCVDWVNYNETCFDENEETDYSFEYTPESKTKSISYSGTFATYSGGGYILDLGPKQSLALEYIQKLQQGNWIDGNTRAVFVEVLTYNANTRVFTHVRVVIETPEIGGVFVNTDVWSANLYPYITSWDFVVLLCQIFFILIIFIRLIRFLVMVCRTKCHCFTNLITWVRLLEIILAIGAISSYIMRIDNTISAIETLFNNFGRFVSFETIRTLEEVYTAMISIVMFLVILQLLKPLTFNYYFYLMRTSLVVAGQDLLGMFVWIIIPMIAFSILLYLYSGYMEEAFRDLPNSFMTLLLVPIGMTLSNSSQGNHTFVTIIYCSYTLLMSMVFISVFISILSIGYNDVKSESTQHEESFDAELSDHLFFTISNIIHSCLPKKKPKFEEEEEPMDFLLEKITELEETIGKLNVEEIHYHKKLSQKILAIKPAPVNYLSCLISWDNNKTIFRYTNDIHKCVFEMTIPDQTLDIKPKISLTKGNRKTKKAFPFNVPENDRTSVFSIGKIPILNTCLNIDIIDVNHTSIAQKTASEIFVSYDNCKSWEVCPTSLKYCISSCENKVAFRAVVKKFPANAVLIFGENSIKTQHGRFEISPQGGEYTICNKTIDVKIEPESVTDKLSVTVKAVPFGIGPMVEILVSDDILKPMKITIPRYEENSRDSNEMIVILKQGDAEWKKLNVLLDIRPDKFQFTLPISNIVKSMRTYIVVKQSEIGWVNRSLPNHRGKIFCTKNPETDVEGLFESNVISTISANLTSDIEILSKSLDLDISNEEMELVQQKNSEGNNMMRKVIVQKWLEKNKLDKQETVKQLDKLLRELGEITLANWLIETEFKMRCSSTSRHETVQLIKAINLVSRFDGVASQWKDIAETLNIDSSLVKNLESGLPRCDIEKCSIVLFRWYQEDSTVTLAKLKHIMEEKGYRAVAARLMYL